MSPARPAPDPDGGHPSAASGGLGPTGRVSSGSAGLAAPGPDHRPLTYRRAASASSDSSACGQHDTCTFTIAHSSLRASASQAFDERLFAWMRPPHEMSWPTIGTLH